MFSGRFRTAGGSWAGGGEVLPVASCLWGLEGSGLVLDAGLFPRDLWDIRLLYCIVSGNR